MLNDKILKGFTKEQSEKLIEWLNAIRGSCNSINSELFDTHDEKTPIEILYARTAYIVAEIEGQLLEISKVIGVDI